MTRRERKKEKKWISSVCKKWDSYIQRNVLVAIHPTQLSFSPLAARESRFPKNPRLNAYTRIHTHVSSSPSLAFDFPSVFPLSAYTCSNWCCCCCCCCDSLRSPAAAAAALCENDTRSRAAGKSEALSGRTHFSFAKRAVFLLCVRLSGDRREKKRRRRLEGFEDTERQSQCEREREREGERERKTKWTIKRVQASRECGCAARADSLRWAAEVCLWSYTAPS